MLLPRFDVLEPASLDKALEYLAEGAPGAAALAGGTDLIVAMKKKLKAPRVVVSLRRIPGLDRIEVRSAFIEIGPLVTMTGLIESEAIRDLLPILADGAHSVAAPLIRNRATVGGNLCNARPCADTAPPLMALGATVVLASARGHREVPLDTMITGPGQTILRPDELLTTIRVPRPARFSSGRYEKMIRRQTLDITIVGAAAQITLDRPGGAVTGARIFATSAAPVPLRLPAAEKCIAGKPLSREVLAAAAAAASRDVQPIDDLRGAAWYRRYAAGVLVKRALARAAERVAGGASTRGAQEGRP